MDVNSLRIFKVFSGGGDVHYVMPHFQREYAWDKSNWNTLLDDLISIYEVYDEDNEPEHFMGALVVINDGTRRGTVPVFKLVDGQQRLITISLLLCALGRFVQASNEGLYKKIRKLLVNADEEGILHFKLLPTTKYDDQSAYLNVINGVDNPPEAASNILVAFEYLSKQLLIKIRRDALDPERLFLVIVNCLHVVFIDLDQRERPYEIFESLNAKGKPLTQPDLVRNYMAMKLPEPHQSHIFERYWSGIEDLLQERRTVSRIGELTSFLRHYLAYWLGALPNKGHVYARFRDRMERNFGSMDAFVDELETLHRFAGYYNRLLRPQYEEDIEIRHALNRLNVLEVATAYPFLLGVYEAYTQSSTTGESFTREDFLFGLQALENYMVRRYLAGEQSAYVNKMFPTLWRELDTRDFISSLRNALIRKNYPSDNRIRQVLITQHVYDKRGTRRLIMILETVNRHLSSGSGGHTVLDDTATVEHIMPQTLNAEWKSYLGDSWEDIYREYLHTIGNLTLVTHEWNASLSNGSFANKRQRLASHALLLNSMYFSAVSGWGAEEIKSRADKLTGDILQIWPSLGEASITKSVHGEKPRTLILMGEAFDVKSWRDVAYQTVEFVAEMSDDFDAIVDTMPTFFSLAERPRSRQLSNGWWVYLNLSSKSVMHLCDELISAVGLSDEDWDVELVD